MPLKPLIQHTPVPDPVHPEIPEVLTQATVCDEVPMPAVVEHAQRLHPSACHGPLGRRIVGNLHATPVQHRILNGEHAFARISVGSGVKPDRKGALHGLHPLI